MTATDAVDEPRLEEVAGPATDTEPFSNRSNTATNLARSGRRL